MAQDAAQDFAARVAGLVAAYGEPSQAAFGSAVFAEHLGPDDDLEAKARGWYQHFLGDQWSERGEAVWMGPWKEVHRRGPGTTPDIVSELRAIVDPDAATSAPIILDVVADAEHARVALAAMFDGPDIADLRIYNLGDGEAMSGILLAGRADTSGDAAFLVFILD